jgi:hypothetical protein
MVCLHVDPALADSINEEVTRWSIPRNAFDLGALLIDEVTINPSS